MVEDCILEGVKIIKVTSYSDIRGVFVKPFNINDYLKINPEINLKEIFYSTSKKNVIRGFHFQNPPYDLEKIVWVTQGEILDVALDIRKNSITYGKCFSIKLSEENNKVLYLPKGIAHAFLSLSDASTVFYCTSNLYSKEHDVGIKWDSAGFEWPIKNPIVSEKDMQLPEFKGFNSPF